MNKHEGLEPGWYISIDETIIAGPFKTRQEAVDSLLPENRLGWTWELCGRHLFLNMPLEDFSIEEVL